VRTNDGTVLGYGKLLLATGGTPRKLPFAPADTCYFRTLEDYHTVRSWLGKEKRIGVIGGGFIGSEIAASLARNSEKPVMSFQEPSLGANIYPPDLSQFLTKYFNDKGVETHGGMDIQGIDTTDQGYVLKSKDGRTVTADHLIAGIGIRPNIELAQAAGIAIADPASGGGILVDKYLQTNIPDIYSAGDVASFYNYGLGRTMRVEHADNARSMGRIAGLNMAGNEIVYDHLPFFIQICSIWGMRQLAN